MVKESKIQADIKKALTKLEYRVEKYTVGVIKTYDGRFINCGASKGHCDMVAYGKNGEAYFLEVKTATGKASKEQLDFLEDMRNRGFRAGIVRSVEDAIKMCEGE